MQANDKNRPGQNRSVLLVAVCETTGTAFVRVLGRAACESGKSFRDLFEGLTQRGFRAFILDLSECVIMDSAILGLISKHAIRFARESTPEDNCYIELVKPSQRILELFDSLGVLKFFRVTNEVGQPGTKHPGPAGASTPDYAPVSEGSSATQEDILCAALEGHETLASLGDANSAKFKDVIDFLRQDLARLRTRVKQPPAPPTNS